jgi:hypothetical protein
VDSYIQNIYNVYKFLKCLKGYEKPLYILLPPTNPQSIMSVNEFKDLSNEALMDLLVTKTNELLAAVELKETKKELVARRKELEKIQLVIKSRQSPNS